MTKPTAPTAAVAPKPKPPTPPKKAKAETRGRSESTDTARPAPVSFWSEDLAAKVGDPDSPESKAWGGQLPQVFTLGALLDAKLPERTPLISPWLHAGETCLLWGGTGCGKSMIAQTLALGAAGGGSVFGWEFPNPGRVLWVDGEQSVRELQGRFSFLASTVEGWDRSRARNNLRWTARAAQPDAKLFVDLASGEQAGGLADTLQREGVRLVIFDNLSTLSDGLEEENAATAFKPMQALLARLKGFNIACIVVHHAGKSLGKFRGSSNIATTFERVIGLVKEEGAAASSLTVKVTVEKFRDKAPPGFQPEFTLKLEGGRWVLGELGELRDAWNLYRDGTHTTKRGFVEEFNRRYGKEKNPAHFRIQFADAWTSRLGVTPEQLKEATQRMEERKEDGGSY